MNPFDAATLIAAITGFVIPLYSCNHEAVPPREI